MYSIINQHHVHFVMLQIWKVHGQLSQKNVLFNGLEYNLACNLQMREYYAKCTKTKICK